MDVIPNVAIPRGKRMKVLDLLSFALISFAAKQSNTNPTTAAIKPITGTNGIYNPNIRSESAPL